MENVLYLRRLFTANVGERTCILFIVILWSNLLLLLFMRFRKWHLYSLLVLGFESIENEIFITVNTVNYSQYWLNALMISGPFRLRLWRTIRINLHTKFINILGWSKARTIICHVTKIDVKGPGATQRIEVLNGKASLWGPTLYPFLTGKAPPFNGIPSLKNGTAFTYLLK